MIDSNAQDISPTRLLQKRRTRLDSLPSEIWGEIYLAYLPLESSNFQYRRAVILLSSVCQLWRTIVLTTSRFWTRIHLTLSKTSVDRMKLCLARSGSLLLSLKIDGQQFEADMLPDVVALLFTCSDRWQDIRIFSPVPNIINDIFSHRHFPSLRILQVDCLSGSSERRLWLSSAAIPWSQLTECSVDLFDLSIMDSLDLLQGSPQLVTCNLTCWGSLMLHRRP